MEVPVPAWDPRLLFASSPSLALQAPRIDEKIRQMAKTEVLFLGYAKISLDLDQMKLYLSMKGALIF